MWMMRGLFLEFALILAALLSGCQRTPEGFANNVALSGNLTKDISDSITNTLAPNEKIAYIYQKSSDSAGISWNGLMDQTSPWPATSIKSAVLYNSVGDSLSIYKPAKRTEQMIAIADGIHFIRYQNQLGEISVQKWIAVR